MKPYSVLRGRSLDRPYLNIYKIKRSKKILVTGVCPCFGLINIFVFRNLLGEDLGPLNSKDLESLERQLDMSLKQIRSTRVILITYMIYNVSYAYSNISLAFDDTPSVICLYVLYDTLHLMC